MNQSASDRGAAPALVAVTPAHNEAEFIANLITSVIEQDQRPLVWVIVDDGSVDATASIVGELAAEHEFIHLLDRPRPEGRALSSKAAAVAAGYACALELAPHATHVASLDADVELPRHAFAFLLDQLAADPQLGVTGGTYVHPVGGRMRPASVAPHQVPGVLQVFRREVFEAVGGYQPLPHGGLDVVSTAHARMLGWKTRAFTAVPISHHRQMGTGGGRRPSVAEYHKGKQDHSLGSGLVFELAKCVRRVPDRPVLIAASARFAGYLSLAVRREPPAVSAQLAAFIRSEQRGRMRIPKPKRRR